MWLTPFLATPAAVAKLSNTVSEEQYNVGKLCVAMTKIAGTAQLVSVLRGRLIGTDSGWLLLEVPAQLVRGAFDALNVPGIELPIKTEGRLKAHISVADQKELESIGGLEKITEKGHHYAYQLGPVKTAVPDNWPEMSRVWFIEIRSRELQKLRMSYGLSPLPKYPFHITIAYRRKNVLRDNNVSKKSAEAVCSLQGTETYNSIFEKQCGEGQPTTDMRCVSEGVSGNTQDAEKSTGSRTISNTGEGTRKDTTAQYVKDARTQDMAPHVVEMPEFKLRDVPTLRWQRNNCLRKLATEFLGVLPRYGSETVQQTFIRANRRERQLYSRELSVGDNERTTTQQNKQSSLRIPESNINISRVGRENRNSACDIVCENQSTRLDNGESFNDSCITNHHELGKEVRDDTNRFFNYQQKLAALQILSRAIGERYKAAHVLVTGHSGAGKTTLAKKLSKEMQLPIYDIDSDRLWKKSKVKDHEDRYKEGTKAYDKFNRVRKKMVDQALDLKKPHIIEGAQLLVDPDRLLGHKTVLVDTPEPRVILQRLVRDKEDGKLDRDGVRKRVEKAKELIDGLRPQVEKLRNNPDVTKMSPPAIQQMADENSEKKADHIPSASTTIAIDIDGTITKHTYMPHKDGRFGKLRDGAREVINKWKKTGHRIIIWTSRDDIQDLEKWLKDNDIHYDEINQNSDGPATHSPKVIAHLYVDDRAINAKSEWKDIAKDVEAHLEAKNKIPIEHIGHYKPAEKVTRQAFSYLLPKGDKDNFAQCSTCRLWTGKEHNTCGILGSETVTESMSCNYYQHGQPNPELAGKEKRILTPKQAGLVDRKVRCENCAFFDKDGYCELYEKLNEAYPEAFDLDKTVDPKGCCNFQTPKGDHIEKHARDAAVWFLEDELSKEKEAAANRISLTVLEPIEKISIELPDTVKRVGLGLAGVGAAYGAGKLIQHGIKQAPPDYLDLGIQLWQNDINKERLTKSLGEPASGMFNMAKNEPKKFRQILLNDATSEVSPDIREKVRNLTFGLNQKKIHRSQLGDVLVTYRAPHENLLAKFGPWVAGSSATHTDVGNTKGNWTGLFAKETKKYEPQFSNIAKGLIRRKGDVNIRSLDEPLLPEQALVRLRSKAVQPITPEHKKMFNEFWKQPRNFGLPRLSQLAGREVLPEANIGETGSAFGLAVTGGAKLPGVNKLLAKIMAPRAYARLRAMGVPDQRAADTCSTAVASLLKQLFPGSIRDNSATYTPAKYLRHTGRGGEFDVEGMQLAPDVATPEKLKQQEWQKWKPLMWRLPFAGGLAALGGYLGHKALKTASAQHGLEVVKMKRRDKEVCICPHCGKEVEDKDLYRDAKGWIFHRPCFTKGKGSIKVANRLRKLAYSGGLGSNPVGGMTANDPPRPSEGDGSTQAAKTSLGGGLFDMMAGTEQTQIPLDNTGVAYSAEESVMDPSYQSTSSIGAQGHTQAPSGAGQNISSQTTGLSGPTAPDLGEMTVDTESTTAAYGQEPHLSA